MEDDQGKQKIFFFSKSVAEAALDGGLPNQNANDLKALLAGNTWYMPVNDTYPKDDGTTVINDHVEQLTFKDNGTIHIEWQQKGETKKSDSVTYEIIGNQLHIGGKSGPNGNGEALDETFTLQSKENGILIFNEGLRLYKDRSKAQVWLDAHPSQVNGGGE